MATGSESEPRQYVGTHFGVQVLVTVWPDGAMQVATRLNDSATWSAPTDLKETE